MGQCSETSTHKIQTPGNHPKERIQQFKDFVTPLILQEWYNCDSFASCAEKSQTAVFVILD